MKKKIIFGTFCLILFLIFTALSYGEIDPKYKARGRPHQEFTSPPIDGEFEDILLLIIPSGNGFSLVVCVKNDSVRENPSLQSYTNLEVKSKSNNNDKRPR